MTTLAGETVAVIDAGFLETDIVGQLTQKGYSVRLLTDNVYGVYQRLGEVGVDLTMVSLIEGGGDEFDDLRRVVQGSDRVMYLGRTAVGATYFHHMNVVAGEAVRQGVSQIILLSSAGTSRPWSLGTVIANNSQQLSLGWKRRAEDEVRASGIPYVIVKAGVVSARQGWRGLLIRQGDLFGTQASKQPGLHASAAASVCVQSLLGLPDRSLTMEVVGTGTQPDCTVSEYDWVSRLGVLLDDGPWCPPQLDSLVAHDRAALSCAILTALFPMTAATLFWMAASLYVGHMIRPALSPQANFLGLLILCVGALGTLMLLVYWRKTLVRGCCCLVPLDYTTRGASGGGSNTSPARAASDVNVNQSQPFLDGEGSSIAIRC